MKFIIKQPIWPPNKNSMVVVNIKDKSIIGAVHDVIDQDHVLLILMSEQGRYILNRNMAWTNIDVSSTPMIRYNFNIYIKSNLTEYVQKHYEAYAIKYNL